MTIDKQADTVIITLNSNCAVSDVEADTDKLRSLVEEFPKFVINAGEVHEIDMAYLQLLLSLKSTADLKKIELVMTSKSPELLHALELCGQRDF